MSERKKRSVQKDSFGEVGSPKSEKENNSAINIPNAEVKELSPANSKLQTEQMEVHHHPQLEHKHKPWKEYLLEGLMIFLAVMMGFFAESYREHLGDNAKEYDYMESLVRDLAADTVALKAGFPIKEARIRAIDSVFLFFESHPEPKTIPVNIYKNIRRAWWDRLYIRNTGTINQLKNSGGLRLVRKPDVRDSLATYDWLWGRLDYYKEAYSTYQQLGGTMIEKLVNANDLIRSYRVNSTGRQLFPSLSDSSIIRINTANLNEYLNFLDRQKITTIQDEQNYKHLEAKAALLIKMIKKEYDLE
jgi:hypothetical protein